MGQQRRHLRYPFEQPVALRAAGVSTFDNEVAVDIGAGGVFVATDTPQPLLSDGTLAVLKPEGGSCLLPIRVMRIVTPTMARTEGGRAGMGLQFGTLSREQRDLVTRLVETARAKDARHRVPRATEAARNVASSDPMLSYVLDAVDGQRRPEELADALGLDHDALVQMLRALWDEGLVDFISAQVSIRPKTPRASADAPELAAAADRSRVLPTAPGCDLRPAERAEIDALHQRAATDDHYRVLGASSSAGGAQIRAAFSNLARRCHPDTHTGRTLGAYGPKVRTIYERARAAYVVLGDAAARAEYDSYREPPRTTAAAATTPRAEPTQEQRRQRADQLKASLRRSGVALKAVERPSAQRPIEPKRAPSAPGGKTLIGTGAPVVDSGPAQGGSLVCRCLDDAEEALQARDDATAARMLDLVCAMESDDDAWRPRYERLYQTVVTRMADSLERKARYHERNRRWDQAVRSWLKVCDARPQDAECHRHAARCLREGGDVRRAYQFSVKAVQLDDTCADNHQALGQALLAAGLKLRARRALEQAARLRGEHRPGWLRSAGGSGQ